MKPVKIPLDQLTADPQNARVHPERNLAAIEASLARFGQQKPIVVAKDGTVVAGNGTLEAARRLGWDALLCVQTDLPPDEARAFAIADNRTAELAEWDPAVLLHNSEQLDGEFRAAMFLGGDADGGAAYEPPEAPSAFPSVDDSIATEYRCPSCGYEWSGKAVAGE